MKLVRLLNLAVLVLLFAAFAAPSQAASRSRDKDKEEKAEPMYPDTSREDPKPKPNSRLIRDLNRMIEASQEEDQTKAKELAEAMIANKRAGNYEKALAHQIASQALMDADDFAGAISHLEQLVATDAMPNDTHFQVMLQLSQMHFQEDRFDEALKWIDRYLTESATKRPEDFALKANYLYRAERFQETIDTMQQALALTKEPKVQWLQFLMAAYFDLGKATEAVGVAEKILQTNPNDENMLRNLMSIYVQADQVDKAIELVASAQARGLLQEAKDYKQLYQLYHYAEKEPQAIETIQAGLAKGVLEPTAELYQTLAEAYYFSDKIPEAIDAYQKAEPLATTGDIALNLARLLINEERFKDAKAAVQAGLQKGVKKPGDAYILLGSIEFGLNNKNAQIAAYKEAAKYPETKEAAETWLKKAGVK